MTDFKYALRQLVRAPGFSLIAVATLAIGIGANTALFSLANAILARPLPEIRESARLAWITPISKYRNRPLNMSYPAYTDYRDQTTAVFSDMAAIGTGPFAISSDGDPIRVDGAYVSSSFFRVLQVRMVLGRTFAADEDRSPGANTVVVIGEKLWQERFGGRADIIGRSMAIGGKTFTVIGVAPVAFNGPAHSDRTDVWVPLSMIGANPDDRSRLLTSRGSWWLSAIGRLKDGVTGATANAAVSTVAAQMVRADSFVSREVVGARIFPAKSGMRPNDMNDVYPVATLAAAVTLLVLLIACANVSNLLLARAAGRRREIGVRLSLGASRGRIVRQLLSEAILLAAAGTAAGFLLSTWATAIMASIIPTPINVSPDGRLLGFTILAALLTGIGFGVVPALHATRADLAMVLKDATVGFDRRRSRLQGGFVVAQLALSLILLTMSGMFLGALYKSSHMDVHLDASDRVLGATFDLSLQSYDTARAARFIAQLREQTSAIPGVRSMTLTNMPPMGNRVMAGEAFAEGRPAPQGSPTDPHGYEITQPTVDVGYFATVGIPLVVGRDFNVNDREGSTPVAIVSEDYARMIWADTNPIGKRVSINRIEGPYLTIVGVAREALTMGTRERQHPTVYVPQRQRPRTLDLTVLVRAEHDARPLAAPLRAVLRGLDRDLPVSRVETLAASRHERGAESRLGSALLSIFGGLALLLATVGTYAVMAFSVAQRRREIGVRVAVGAAGSQIISLFIGEGFRLAAVGIGFGLVLAAVAAKLLSSMFLGLTAIDLIPVAAVTLLLVGAALMASWIPARRAARVDPMVALRAD